MSCFRDVQHGTRQQQGEAWNQGQVGVDLILEPGIISAHHSMLFETAFEGKFHDSMKRGTVRWSAYDTMSM